MWISAIVKGGERAILIPLPEDVAQRRLLSLFR
mgnify:CR=1 FL=1